METGRAGPRAEWVKNLAKSSSNIIKLKKKKIEFFENFLDKILFFQLKILKFFLVASPPEPHIYYIIEYL